MSFIDDDFLLHADASRRLYHEYAAAEPILDYHCHLPPRDIADNRRFHDLFEIWLEGDHYKWRAMRADGVPESCCTGDAPPFEKFMAWARTVPHTLRNPLFHWTHLELKRYFGIDRFLNESSARGIWDEANSQLASDDLRAHGILRRFKVRALCTTDDPTDDLAHHRRIAASSLETHVYPAFRPDKALSVDQPELFNAWTDRLAAASNVDIPTLDRFLSALRQRHQYFHQMGCRLSDHGLNHCYAEACDEARAAAIFNKARSRQPVTSEEQAQFASFLMRFFGRLDAEKRWTQQLHLGARRNANSRRLRQLGADSGYDSIGDWPQANALGKYLDHLDRDDALPKTIVYNLNPADNYAFASMIGNFQDGAIPGKIQFGSGWWFLDQKDGITLQLNALSNTGLLSRFIGMLTDSRSFMSYPRHEYFRRVLCNLLGEEMEKGELPRDFAWIGGMVRDVCYANASRYLALEDPAGVTQAAVCVAAE
jgi:glucuronate isomerase